MADEVTRVTTQSKTNNSVSGGPAAPKTVSGPKHRVKSIYFPDKTKVERIEELLSRYPRTNLSSVLAQLVPALIHTLEETPSDQRQLKINATVWV